MEKTTYFGHLEIVLIIVNSITCKLFLIFPGTFAKVGASASILVAVLVTVIEFIFFIITASLYKRFEGMDIINISEKYLGKYVSYGVSILMILFFLIVEALLFRTFVESIKLTMLPKSPIWYISLFFIFAMVIGSFVGIKAIIRTSSILVPIIIGLTILLISFSIPSFDLNNIYPIFGNGSSSFINGSFLVSYFAEFIFLLLLIPYVKPNLTYKKLGFGILTISSIMMILTVATYIFSVPLREGNEYFLPMYSISQIIDYDSFISKIESVFSLGWFLSFFINISMGLYFICLIFGRMFKAKSIRPSIFPFAFIIFSISLLPRNTSEVLKALENATLFEISVGIVMPILILIFANICYKKVGT